MRKVEVVEMVVVVVVVVRGVSGDIFISLHLISLCVSFSPRKIEGGKLKCILIPTDSYFNSKIFFPPMYISPKFFFSWGNCLLLTGLGLLIKDQFSC